MLQFKTDRIIFQSEVLMATATCRGNEPMAALIKEKDTCSNALVDLWCVIDFMEKAGFEKEKSRKMVGKLGQRKLQEGWLEGFILLLFLVFWGTAKLLVFNPEQNSQGVLSTIFRSELEEMPLTFLLEQGFCVNDLIEFLLWPGYIPPPPPQNNLKWSTWTNKSRAPKIFIKPVNQDQTRSFRRPPTYIQLVNRPSSPPQPGE